MGTSKSERVSGLTGASGRHADDETRRRSEESFRKLIEQSPYGVFVIDSEFRFAVVSRGAEATFRTITPLIGRDFAEALKVVWPEPFASEAIGRFRHTLETGESYRQASLVETRADTDEVESYDWQIERITMPNGEYGVVCHYYDLSERQTFEKKLTESRERLRAALDGSGAGTFRWDIRTNSLDWDDNLDRLFGLSPGETIRSLEKFIELVHPDDRAGVIESCERCAAEGANFDMEFRVVWPDGTVRWIDDKGRTYLDQEGQPAYMTGMCLDVTARKSAEHTLRESEKLKQLRLTEIESLYSAAPIGLVLLDLDFRFVRINDSLAQMNGFAPEEHLGKSVYDILPAVADEAYRAFREVVETRKPVRAELVGSTPANPSGVWDEHWYPVLDDAGELIGVGAVVTDISEQRAVEKELQKNIERFDLVRDGAGVGFWFCDLPFDKLVWDKRVKEHFWLPEDAEVTIDTFYERIHPDDRERTRLAIEESIASKGLYEINYRTIADNGLEKWVRATGRTYYSEDGQPTRFDGVTIDITHRVLAEQALFESVEREKAARREAEHANRAKDEFLAVLSHELRSPLNSMYGWTQILKKESSKPEMLAKGLDVLARNVKLQNELIEDLLDISRIISGKMEIEKENVSLIAAVQAALEAVQPSAGQRDLSIDVEFDPEADLIQGDQHRLQQIVTNLLSNAIKFTQPGGRIEVNLRKVARKAVLSIKDSGVGISQDSLERIFERFWQEDGSQKRSYGGLGLGLAIVRTLVELHGGTVRAESQGLGTGAVFTVELPLEYTLETYGIMALKESYKEWSIGRTSLTGLRLLIVDDDEDTLEIMRLALKREGALVESSHNAEEALQKLSTQTFDLLISDIGMASLDGFDLIRTVRQRLDINTNIPAIALTGFVSVADKENAISAGFHAHLSKPVDFTKLKQTIETVLENRTGEMQVSLN